MIMKNKMNELFEYLRLLLSHQPEKEDLNMVNHGWVSAEQLINRVNHHSSNKLDKSSVVANFATTAADGKSYQVDYYS